MIKETKEINRANYNEYMVERYFELYILYPCKLKQSDNMLVFGNKNGKWMGAICKGRDPLAVMRYKVFGELF